MYHILVTGSAPLPNRRRLCWLAARELLLLHVNRVDANDLSPQHDRIMSQGPIDYKLYEAYGGGAGKAVSAVLNNPRGTQCAIGAIAAVAVSGRYVRSPGGVRECSNLGYTSH